ncbi:phosphate ABC transporter substrate-binding protein, PhoT family [Polynucleobacter meluiroseus]|uniref:Phosphate-binding protein PstS n=1 Tax=Polynucleobacter meluiroseus TaxID=1938814 RepID=A0A240E274_9BURK|nr:phosphate ABC transporter substrate-binding protein PstS [Polynucleobacter meluiroseus]SNX29529.1 phosphate ABC transporter substrate-binding protein, PhoT family [Polynucleobacter meluiroseus]
MSKLNLSKLVAATLLLSSSLAYSAELTGAGSSFIFPVLSKWAEAYKAKTGNSLNYQSIGSGGGIKQIKAKTVDFGASDAPLKFEELQAAGMVQFPAIIGGVVPIVNIDGIKPGQLKLSGDLLSDIFQGIVTNWDDKRVALLNPGIKIPAGNITVVTRSDGSGTTAIFTDYLSKASGPSGWKEAVGSGASVKWPAASTVSGKGNEGVAANVARIKNSIGYVEFAYAKKNSLSYTQMKNMAGQFVLPEEASFAAASAGTDWSKVPGMGTFITNAPGAKAWPITGATFVIIYKQPENKASAAEVLKFFDFAFTNGKKAASELDYVPMPDATVDYIRNSVWSQVQTK